jgi:hypothetical protein
VQDLGVATGIIVVKINSNYGADYTCLYRVSVATSSSSPDAALTRSDKSVIVLCCTSGPSPRRSRRQALRRMICSPLVPFLSAFFFPYLLSTDYTSPSIDTSPVRIPLSLDSFPLPSESEFSSVHLASSFTSCFPTLAQTLSSLLALHAHTLIPLRALHAHGFYPLSSACIESSKIASDHRGNRKERKTRAPPLLEHTQLSQQPRQPLVILQ